MTSKDPRVKAENIALRLEHAKQLNSIVYTNLSDVANEYRGFDHENMNDDLRKALDAACDMREQVCAISKELNTALIRAKIALSEIKNA